MYSISTVFPMYNEEQNILPTVNETLEVLNSTTTGVEIIIVDDDGADNTGRMDENKAKFTMSNKGYS